MNEERAKRKLSAILSADVKGYSRLMGEDELATIETLKKYQQLISSLTDEFRGRVVDSPGDNLLAEFGSVVDAVECAVKIQEELKKENDQFPENRRMEFRIGVNLGDVVEDGKRIYGDGVNIAARIESLAEPGGICISGRVHDHIENKLDLKYEYLGDRKVKNISKPIGVYRVKSPPGAAAHRTIHVKKAVKMKWRKIALVLIPILVLAAVVVWIWENYFRLPQISIASEKKITLNLPKGPSIAVLPFVNLSDDPQQDYFVDGLTENIITGLSACPNLFVIARNSSFVYKNKPLRVKKVADELGVQYVVEGSVLKTKDRLRISAQLIDASTEHHLWAEKYDRDLDDIFKLQDEITIKIITALAINLTEGEQLRLKVKTTNLEVFMKAFRAGEYLWQNNKESNVLARQLLEEVIQLDPESSEAHALLAASYIGELWLGSESPIISLAQASKYTKQALDLDNSNSDAYMLLSELYMMRKQHDQAIAAAKQAITLNPNNADAYHVLGMSLWTSERQLEAIDIAKKAIRLNPFPPSLYFVSLGSSYFGLERYEEALESFMKAVQTNPKDIFAHLLLTCTYSLMGREGEAREEVLEVLSIDPDFSLSYHEKIHPAKNKDYVKACIEAARKAGLPD